MNLRNILVISLLAMIFLSAGSVFAQTCVFKLYLNDSSGKLDSLTFGHADGATYCIDASLGEVEAPPKPPVGVWDARFVDTRSVAGRCLEGGLHPRSFQSAVRDTFMIEIQYSDAADPYPLHIEWDLPPSTHWVSMVLQDRSNTAQDPNPDVNMMQIDSADFVAGEFDVNRIRIIAQRVDPMPACEGAVHQESSLIPESFGLTQNYPNPFNPTTTVKFFVEKSSKVDVAVFDILGRRVATLASEQMMPGTYSADWNGKTDAGVAVASGMYFLRMTATSDDNRVSFFDMKKMLLMK